LKIPLSVTIIAKNEEAKIAQAIQSVQFAQDILVVDAESSDATVQNAQRLGARVLVHPWPGYGQQKNFAQDHTSCEWVLNIDADEWVSDELALELTAFFSNGLDQQEHRPQLYKIARRALYGGVWVKHGGWYPARVSRFGKKSAICWTEPAVHEQLVLKNGQHSLHPGFKGQPIGQLKADLWHASFDGIADQVQTNLRFATLGAQQIAKEVQGEDPFFWVKLLFKPWAKFLETYVWKRGFLDGFYGFVISVNAAHSMFLKIALFLERRKQSEDGKKNPRP
jgi:glycosyltransferase involved in cell wall biosynthesis